MLRTRNILDGLGMSLWGVTPLLAAALVGVGLAGHPLIDGQPIVRSVAIQPPATRAPADMTDVVRPSPKATSSAKAKSSASASPSAAPTLQMTTPVLKQTSGDEWQTTVLVAGANQGCPTAVSNYSLETTSPGGSFTPETVTTVSTGAPGPPLGTPPVKALSCQVMLTFADGKLREVPATAALVIDGSSSLPLAISRNVTYFYYFGIPVIVGAVMAVLLLLLSVVFVPVYDLKGNKERVFSADENGIRGFWEHSVSATGTWTANDSWATNIGVVTGVIATILGAISATDVLFRGVAIDRFAILNIIAAVIIAAAPLVVGVRYARWLRRHPGLTDQGCLELPGTTPVIEDIAELGDGTFFGLVEESVVILYAQLLTQCPAEVHVPSGAVITPSWNAVARSTTRGDPQPTRLETGSKIQVPPGSTIGIRSAHITLPGGSDIFAQGKCILDIRNSNGRLAVKGTRIEASQSAKSQEVAQRFPVLVTGPDGAQITVNGVARVTVPEHTKFSAPFRKEGALPLSPEWRTFRWPQGSNSFIGTMGMVILAGIVTMIGIGVELGIAGVLAVGLSEASTFGRWVAFVILSAVGIFTLTYSVTAIRTLADPQPGSSMSSSAGTSFTL
jgi:hypothetical protein